MEAKPKRGDLVYYCGTHFYFQPNGNTCFLFDKREHVGKTYMAAFTPKITAVKLLKPEKVSSISDIDLRLGPTSPDVDELLRSMRDLSSPEHEELSDRLRHAVWIDHRI